MTAVSFLGTDLVFSLQISGELQLPLQDLSVPGVHIEVSCEMWCAPSIPERASGQRHF